MAFELKIVILVFKDTTDDLNMGLTDAEVREEICISSADSPFRLITDHDHPKLGKCAYSIYFVAVNTRLSLLKIIQLRVKCSPN